MLLQEETFLPLSAALRACISRASNLLKGKPGVDDEAFSDALTMAKAFLVILGDSSQPCRLEDPSKTAKALTTLQKLSPAKDAEVFAAVYHQLQQGISCAFWYPPTWMLLPNASFFVASNLADSSATLSFHFITP